MPQLPIQGSQIGIHENVNQLLIVIPVLNEEAHIAGLVERIRMDPACRDALIVIPDGGSTDDTVRRVALLAERDPLIRLIDVSPGGIPVGVNRAVHRFSNNMTWLLRLDAHARYPDHFATGLLREIEETGADAVVVRMHSEGYTCLQRAIAQAQNALFGSGGADYRTPGQGRWVAHGHHALFRLDTFNRHRGYDEIFDNKAGLSAEDIDLDQRVAVAGGRIWLSSSVPMTYYPRRTLSSLFRQYYGYGGGRAVFFAIHCSQIKIRHLVLPCIFMALVLALLSPFTLTAAVPGVLWLGTNLAIGGAKAIASGQRCSLLSGVAAAVMQLAWSVGFWIKLPLAIRTAKSRRQAKCSL